MLVKTSEVMNLSLEYLGERIHSVATNENIISAVVAPDNGRMERTVEIQQLLNNTRTSSDLVKNVYFYVEYDQTVYMAQERFYTEEPVDPLEIIAYYDALSEKEPGQKLCNLSEQCIFDSGVSAFRRGPLRDSFCFNWMEMRLYRWCGVNTMARERSLSVTAISPPSCLHISGRKI